MRTGAGVNALPASGCRYGRETAQYLLLDPKLALYASLLRAGESDPDRVEEKRRELRWRIFPASDNARSVWKSIAQWRRR